MINYIKQSVTELKDNVTWTKMPEAQKMTITVALFSVFLSLGIWGADTVLIRLISLYSSIVN